MKGKYAIVNDVDKPYRRLVTEVIDGKHFYMARSEEVGLRQYDGMEPTQPTFLEDFGFVMKEIEGTNRIHFNKVGASTASYRDGKPRQWQGEFAFDLPKVTFSDKEKKKFKIN